ncbi:MAG: hypothetical protein J1G38_04065 [Clostridiales bacterium]|nr:hypothetical protein [Clostridiales bacterium]
MNLCKGVFWIADNAEKYLFRIPCDIDGNVIGKTEYPLNSKDGSNYNHKKLWATLPKDVTFGKPFDYFPRGRVEIRNAKATVYLNPNINNQDVQGFIAGQFGLTEENLIKSVRFVSDGSNHYKYSYNKGEIL